jgi:3-oxoadipate enol-lactonase
MKLTESTAKPNGIDIHYRVFGEGEPLLLIMGLGGNADWWDKGFLEPLAERYQVVTFDNRGAGRSGTPDGPYTIPLMASDTSGLMEHLGWRSANIVGFSMGGMIAQELACTHPEKVRRLVLISTNCGGQESINPKPEVYAALTMPREGLTVEDIARASLYMLFPPEFIEKERELMDKVVKGQLIAPIKPSCFMAQLNGVNTWSIHSRLCSLDKPTLIIAGDQDILIPPENSRILADVIPNSHLAMKPGAGHGITSMFPGEIAAKVLAFLA